MKKYEDILEYWKTREPFKNEDDIPDIQKRFQIDTRSLALYVNEHNSIINYNFLSKKQTL